MFRKLVVIFSLGVFASHAFGEGRNSGLGGAKSMLQGRLAAEASRRGELSRQIPDLKAKRDAAPAGSPARAEAQKNLDAAQREYDQVGQQMQADQQSLDSIDANQRALCGNCCGQSGGGKGCGGSGGKGGGGKGGGGSVNAMALAMGMMGAGAAAAAAAMGGSGRGGGSAASKPTPSVAPMPSLPPALAEQIVDTSAAAEMKPIQFANSSRK